MLGLIGRKVGMTQIYDDKGVMVPVTVIEAGPCTVIQVKQIEKDGRPREGYNAVQLGFGTRRAKTVSKAEAGHCAKADGRAPVRVLREFRVDDVSAFERGQNIDVSIFHGVKKVDVQGVSIGRGFQGTRKRHHFSGGKKTHGTTTHDQPGSIGASAYPSRVIKGKKLPGQMGNATRTVKNLVVLGVDTDAQVLLLRGSVPGARNSFLMIHPVPEKKRRARHLGA
jgi:large subunit ribosomal protein L3